MSITQGVESLRAHHFGGPAKSTLLLTVTPPTELSRFRARSGPAAAYSFRRKTSGRRAILKRVAAGGGKGAIPQCSSPFWSRRLRRAPPLGALQIQRLTPDLAPWDLEDHAGVRELLCELGHQGALSRDAHLRLLSERCGVALITLQEAARELAQGADADP